MGMACRRAVQNERWSTQYFQLRAVCKPLVEHFSEQEYKQEWAA